MRHKATQGSVLFLVILFSTIYSFLNSIAQDIPIISTRQILFIDEYPKYEGSRSDASATVFMLSQLDYDSVRRFQEENNLKPDGIIGPKTFAMARRKYLDKKKPRKPDNNKTLSLFVDDFSNLVNGRQTIKINLTNNTNDDICCMGLVSYGEDNKFILRDAVAVLESTEKGLHCMQEGDVVSCYETSTQTPIGVIPQNTIIKSSKKIIFSTIVGQELESHFLDLKYIDSSLSHYTISLRIFPDGKNFKQEFYCEINNTMEYSQHAKK